MPIGDWLNLAVGKSCNIGNLGVAERSDSFAAGWSLALFLVGGKVEGDEEEEVRAEYSHSRESCEFLTSTLSCIGHPWPVGGGKVCVRCEVNETWAKLAHAGWEQNLASYQDQSRIG